LALNPSPLPDALARAPLARALGWRAENLGLGAMQGLIEALGPDRASAFSGALWRKLAPLNKRHARADGHLAAAMPELTPAERSGILGDMWENLGRTTAESFHLTALLADRTRFEIGPDTLAAVESAKARGAVFVSLHQGNWELAAPLLNALGLPVAGVYQKLQNPLAEARALALRAPHYPLGLFAKGHETARMLLKLVGNGGTVAIMADLRDVGGVEVPFFHRPAPSTAFPALIARTRGVPLFAGVVRRKAGARFSITVEEIPVQTSDNRQDDITATTASIQACFERFVRATPGQWMWGHRRWAR
jgi:Kdo2-lipid IVA lauroyltransferase/acyltransferase